ncbi:MAG TPA: hypothetical protein VNU01_08525 [Egibacteraceae bacterium]|nr:hypothetical protein [Egibacteraceae bacterium]
MDVLTATVDHPADLNGDLGRELVASALLMLLVLTSTGVVLGSVLGALWLFA